MNALKKPQHGLAHTEYSLVGALLTSLFPGGLRSGPHSLSQIRKSKPWENLLSIAEAAKRLGGISKWTLHARFHNVA